MDDSVDAGNCGLDLSKVRKIGLHELRPRRHPGGLFEVAQPQAVGIGEEGREPPPDVARRAGDEDGLHGADASRSARPR